MQVARLEIQDFQRLVNVTTIAELEYYNLVVVMTSQKQRTFMGEGSSSSSP